MCLVNAYVTRNPVRSQPKQAVAGQFCRELLPPALSFYRRELGDLSRPDRRGWARPKSGCPFHSSESKTSFHVHRDGGFFCFGCGAKGGDLVDYVRLRDTVDFKSAARKLGAWIDVTRREQQKELRRREKERRRQQEKEAERIEKELMERISARDLLHATETLYREAIADHDWILMSELLRAVREAEERYYRLANLEVAHEY